MEEGGHAREPEHNESRDLPGKNTMRRLISAGILQEGKKVEFQYKDKHFYAELDSEGGLRTEDEYFNAPSSFATSMARRVNKEDGTETSGKRDRKRKRKTSVNGKCASCFQHFECHAQPLFGSRGDATGVPRRRYAPLDRLGSLPRGWEIPLLVPQAVAA